MKTVHVNAESVAPGKIVCIGRNYVAHIEELNNAIPEQMVVFHKPNTAISNTLMSFHEEPLHYEGEICILIRDRRPYAVGFGLDLTKRGLQSQLKAKGLPWERAKAFKGAAVFGSFVPLVPADMDDLSLELDIDDQRVQTGHCRQMIYPIPAILTDLATYTELDDNDIIMTGTPKGVGLITKGSRFSGRILANGHCLAEAEWVAK